MIVLSLKAVTIIVASISTKKTTPKMVRGILKATSECNTFVEGRPPK
jgi:hypothetical protein